jgi:hypothetical protein
MDCQAMTWTPTKPTQPGMLIGGRCGYADILEDGLRECQEMGLRITVRDEFGHLHSVVRCIDHSDWIEAGPLEPPT